MDFPTLTAQPIYPLSQQREDAVIRNSSESGYVLTRPRFTRSRRSFDVVYNGMSSGDFITLEDFYVNSCGNGSAMFNWTHPETLEVLTVRFKEPISSSLPIPNRCSVQMKLEEV